MPGEAWVTAASPKRQRGVPPLIGLYAVNKHVTPMPYVTTSLILAETSVSDQHWSVRKGTNKEK
jgi:hypothetical protein